MKRLISAITIRLVAAGIVAAWTAAEPAAATESQDLTPSAHCAVALCTDERMPQCQGARSAGPAAALGIADASYVERQYGPVLSGFDLPSKVEHSAAAHCRQTSNGNPDRYGECLVVQYATARTACLNVLAYRDPEPVRERLSACAGFGDVRSTGFDWAGFRDCLMTAHMKQFSR